MTADWSQINEPVKRARNASVDHHLTSSHERFHARQEARR